MEGMQRLWGAADSKMKASRHEMSSSRQHRGSISSPRASWLPPSAPSWLQFLVKSSKDFNIFKMGRVEYKGVKR